MKLTTLAVECIVAVQLLAHLVHSGCISGDVKIATLNGRKMGYVYDTAWRPICGHWFWDNQYGASLICKKLGHTSGAPQPTSRGSRMTVRTFQVGKCKSSNTKILTCTDGHNDRVYSDKCAANKDTGYSIYCTGSGSGYTDSCAWRHALTPHTTTTVAPTAAPPPTTAPPPPVYPQDCRRGDVRIHEQNGRKIGWVYDRVWKPICGHWFWDNEYGANIICKALGYDLGGSRPDPRGKSISMKTYQIGKCRSTDTSILGCTDGHNDREFTSKCAAGKDTGYDIVCRGAGSGFKDSCRRRIGEVIPEKTVTPIDYENCEEGDVKLTRDNLPYIYYKGKFERICGHHFWNNKHGANLFCQQLGKPVGLHFGKERRTRLGEKALRIGQCNDDDQELLRCKGGGNKMNYADCGEHDKAKVQISCEGIRARTEVTSCKQPGVERGTLTRTVRQEDCKDDNQCGELEGHCGKDKECKAGLYCREKFCQKFPKPFSITGSEEPWYEQNKKDRKCWNDGCEKTEGFCPARCGSAASTRDDKYAMACCRRDFWKKSGRTECYNAGCDGDHCCTLIDPLAFSQEVATFESTMESCRMRGDTATAIGFMYDTGFSNSDYEKMGVSGLFMICKDGEKIFPQMANSDEASEQYLKPFVEQCPDGHSVTGINTQTLKINSKDNMGIVDIRVICSDGSVLESGIIDKDLKGEDTTEWQCEHVSDTECSCPPGQAVRSVKVKLGNMFVQQGKVKDKVGIVGVEFECATRKTVPVIKWKSSDEACAAKSIDSDLEEECRTKCIAASGCSRFVVSDGECQIVNSVNDLVSLNAITAVSDGVLPGISQLDSVAGCNSKLYEMVQSPNLCAVEKSARACNSDAVIKFVTDKSLEQCAAFCVALVDCTSIILAGTDCWTYFDCGADSNLIPIAGSKYYELGACDRVCSGKEWVGECASEAAHIKTVTVPAATTIVRRHCQFECLQTSDCVGFLLDLEGRECTLVKEGCSPKEDSTATKEYIQMGECNLEGRYGQWAEWGDCSAKCGYGVQNRTRLCDEDYGIPCKGDAEETQSCIGPDDIKTVACAGTIICSPEKLKKIDAKNMESLEKILNGPTTGYWRVLRQTIVAAVTSLNNDCIAGPKKGKEGTKYCSSAPAKDPFCELWNEYVTMENNTNSKIVDNSRPLLVNTNHKELLKQLVLKDFKSTVVSKIEDVKNTVITLDNEMRKDMAGYFEAVAAFEEEKGIQDMEWFQESADFYEDKTNQYMGVVKNKLKEIMILAMSKNAADIFTAVLNFYSALFDDSIGNPFNPISMDAEGALADLTAQVNNMAGSIIVFGKLGRMGQLIKKISTGQNLDQIRFAQFKRRIEELKENPNKSPDEAVKQAKVMLAEYNGGTYGVSADDVGEMLALMDAIFAWGCDQIRDSSSSAGNAIAAGAIMQGDCTGVGTGLVIENLKIAIEDGNGHREDLFNALLNQAKAIIKRQMAANIGREVMKPTMPKRSFYTASILALGYKRDAILAACDSFQYENYGTMIEECARMTSSSQVDPLDLDLAKLISWQLSTVPSCTSFKAIPVPASPDRNPLKGEINTKALYTRGSTDFEIPDMKHAISMHIFDKYKNVNKHMKYGYYVKQFGLYLPEDSNQDSTEITIKHKSIQKLTPKGRTFKIPAEKISPAITQYKYNAKECNTEIKPNPYTIHACRKSEFHDSDTNVQPTLSPICSVKEGKIADKKQPSLFGKWEIQLSNNLKGKPWPLAVPRVAGVTHFRADITVCTLPTVTKPGADTSECQQPVRVGREMCRKCGNTTYCQETAEATAKNVGCCMTERKLTAYNNDTGSMTCVDCPARSQLSTDGTFCKGIKLNGGLSDWGKWTCCDSSTHRRVRKKSCTNPIPQFGGAPCTGTRKEEESCTAPFCTAAEKSLQKAEEAEESGDETGIAEVADIIAEEDSTRQAIQRPALLQNRPKKRTKRNTEDNRLKQQIENVWRSSGSNGRRHSVHSVRRHSAHHGRRHTVDNGTRRSVSEHFDNVWKFMQSEKTTVDADKENLVDADSNIVDVSPSAPSSSYIENSIENSFKRSSGATSSCSATEKCSVKSSKTCTDSSVCQEGLTCKKEKCIRLPHIRGCHQSLNIGCCTEDKKCYENEGSCSSNAECFKGFKCVTDGCSKASGETVNCCKRSDRQCTAIEKCAEGQGVCSAATQCQQSLTCGEVGSCYGSGFDTSARCCVPGNCVSDLKGAAFCYAAMSMGFCSSEKVASLACCFTCKYSRCRGKKDCCTQSNPCIEYDGECTDDNQCKGDANKCHEGACPAAYPESQFKSNSKCCSKTAPSPAGPSPAAPETTTVPFGFKFGNEKVWGSCPDENGMIQGFTYQYNAAEATGMVSTTNDIHDVHCLNGPSLRSGSTCKELDWKKTFDSDLVWAKCPTGYFLKAIFRNNGYSLKYLDNGICCKPNDQPIEEVYINSECQVKHDQFARSGTYKCPENFALAGLQREGGNNMQGFSNFWCCPLVRTPATPVTSVTDV